MNLGRENDMNHWLQQIISEKSDYAEKRKRSSIDMKQQNND